MSRGLGKYQRMILERLEIRDCFYLIELLPQEYKLRQYQSLMRAADRLARLGKLKFQTWMCGRNRVAVARLNFVVPANPRYRINVLKEVGHRCTDVKYYRQKRLKAGQERKALPIPGELTNEPFADMVKDIIDLKPGEYEVSV